MLRNNGAPNFAISCILDGLAVHPKCEVHGLEGVKKDFERILRQNNEIALLVIGLLIIFEKNEKIALGFCLGSFVSNINFIVLYICLIKSMRKGYMGALIFTFVSYLIRMVLAFSILRFCLKLGANTFIASITGLMVIKLVIYSNTIFGRWERWNSSQG